MPAAIHQPAPLPAPQRPASRTLWLATLLVVAVFTVVRLILFSTLDLRTDEAYYWTWSQESAVSFLDHPPMVAWFVRLGTFLFGDNPFGARFAGFLTLPLLELVFADIVRRRTGSMSAALLVVLALESTVNFGVTSMIIEPGIPLLLFAGLMFWSLCRLDETGDARWWLAVGLFGGLSLLSKYTALLYLPAILLFVMAPAGNRRWLISPWFWGAGVIALLVFSPVIWWNAQHDWASFQFQGVRATKSPSLDLSNLLSYLATNLAFTGPLLVVVTIWGSIVLAWRALRQSDGFALALGAAFLVPLVYLGERGLFLSVNPSWAIIMWPFGIAALAIAAYAAAPAAAISLRRAAFVAVITGLPLTAGLLFHGAFDTGVWLGGRDPVGGDAGYESAATEILAAARANNATWIATSDYRTYAVLRWHLWRDIPVVMVVERSRFIDFALPDMTQIAGHPGLYVSPPGQSSPLVEQATVQHSRPLGTVNRVWRAQVMNMLNLQLIDGWTPDLTPEPGSPFYRWPDLA